MEKPKCPKCQAERCVKHGIVQGRQRYWCKSCNYRFTVLKAGKRLENYYIAKALQLYLEGIDYRKIEKLLGVSHVTVINWVKQYGQGLQALRAVKKHILTEVREIYSFNGAETKKYTGSLLLTGIGNKSWVIEEKTA